MIDETYRLSSIIPIVVSILTTGIISLFIGIYIEKLRRKMSYITYDIQYQPLATSSKTDWGKIEVFHNGTQKNHLNFVTIHLENDSSSDLSDLTIELGVDPESHILGQSGYYDDSKKLIYLDDAYLKYFNDVSERYSQHESSIKNIPDYQIPSQLSNEVNSVLKNKKFFVPVFNRGTSLTFNLLIENLQSQIPVASITLLHKSVKLKKRDDQQTENLKTLKSSTIITFILLVAGLAILISIYPTATVALLILFALIFLCSILGIIVHLVGRWLKKQIW